VTRYKLERERTQLDMLTLQGRVFDLEGTVDFALTKGWDFLKR
jgi:hypothetical protein